MSERKSENTSAHGAGADSAAAAAAAAESEVQKHPAEKPLSPEALAHLSKVAGTRAGTANNGTLGLLPSEVLERVQFYSARSAFGQLVSTSRFFRDELQPELHFYRYLRCVLRDEKTLPPLSSSDDGGAAAAAAGADATEHPHLTTSQRHIYKSVLALFDAYEAYFNDFMTIELEHGNHCRVWPAKCIETLSTSFSRVQAQETAIPKDLFVATGLDVLKISAEYGNLHASLASTNESYTTAYSDQLDALQVKKLGAAQKSAGNDYIDGYFTGESPRENLPEELSNLDSDLGIKYSLICRGQIFPYLNLGKHGDSGPFRPWIILGDALQTLNVLRDKLTSSLGSANNVDQKPCASAATQSAR